MKCCCGKTCPGKVRAGKSRGRQGHRHQGRGAAENCPGAAAPVLAIVLDQPGERLCFSLQSWEPPELVDMNPHQNAVHQRLQKKEKTHSRVGTCSKNGIEPSNFRAASKPASKETSKQANKQRKHKNKTVPKALNVDESFWVVHEPGFLGFPSSVFGATPISFKTDPF